MYRRKQSHPQHRNWERTRTADLPPGEGKIEGRVSSRPLFSLVTKVSRVGRGVRNAGGTEEPLFLPPGPMLSDLYASTYPVLEVTIIAPSYKGGN